MPATPPGATRDATLNASLDAAYAALGPAYRPRTEHFAPDGRALFVNRLIHEPSPYLRQHAHNPVDWRPWGDEAFAEAAARDIPVFLSVGYATCHWCHVMEEESFDDVEVAAILNADFIPVKLDREQRPDLDQIYIMATQIQQSHAGWPNSVWLTPKALPFHTGTYFPKPHFMQVLSAVSQAWASGRRPEILQAADALSAHIARFGQAAEAAGEIGPEIAAHAAASLTASANRKEGGFSSGTQFPQEGFILFLLDHWRRTGDQPALTIALEALDGIAAGGVHDHVGGGFHRYSVDVNWRTPHFEKMLYNQAQLTRAYVQAWEATGRETYRRAATRCLDYVAREMTAPSGAFYTAEDADNLDANGKREEGEFYVWPPALAQKALGDDAAYAIAELGLTEHPTLEAGPVAHLRPGEPVDFARLDPILDRLRGARAARNRPIRDEKVIAGWNGLMIRAFAEAAIAFDRPDYTDIAARAYTGAREALKTEGWARIAAEDERRETAGLEDHAWLGLAALALHDATGDAGWLAEAETQAAAFDAFAHGDALKMTREDGPIGPVTDTDDGALPSGQSSALELLARLDRRKPDPDRRARAQRLLGALSGPISKQPTLRPLGLVAAAVLAGGESEARRAAGPVRVRASFVAGTVHIVIEPEAGWKVAADTLALEGDKLGPATRPEPITVAAAAGMPTQIFDRKIAMTARAERPCRVQLTLQLCNDRECRLPESLSFRFA